MEPLSYIMENGSLNQVYDKIKNCRVVKPPYAMNGHFGNKFFLDKRYGLENFYTGTGKVFYDVVTIKGKEFYLYQEGGKSYIGTFNGATFTNVSGSGFTISSDSPKKIVIGKGIYGPKYSSRSTITPELGIGDKDFPGIPGYAGGYVKFAYTGTQDVETGDFIVFKSGVLAGGINRVELVEAGFIYIIGTNARGTIPATGTEFDFYKKSNTSVGSTILVGHTTGVNLLILDGNNSANTFAVFTTTSEPIIDLVNFDGNIFALSDTHMYFSRTTFGSNTQFYPLDNYYVDGGYKLFPIGKALLAFGRTNKLFAAANGTNQNIGYVGYDVNYNGNLYSKYSCIFADQTIYILQDDKQLKQVDIVQNNTVTFDLNLKDVLVNNKGLFYDLDGGEVFMNNSTEFLHFLYVKSGTTVDYEFDKINQHFILQEYNLHIYHLSTKILSSNIYTRGTYLDNGVAYSQEVNLSAKGLMGIYMPNIIRTLFGISDLTDPLELDLEIEFELGGKIQRINRKLNGYKFDLELITEPTLDELIGYDTIPTEVLTYDGTIASIQQTILKSGRYIRFKYTSINRFIIGESLILTDKSKIFINELDFNN